jgi:hypothetical protein
MHHHCKGQPIASKLPVNKETWVYVTLLQPVNSFISVLQTRTHLAGAGAKLQALKAMTENVVAYFHPQDPDSASRAPELLDMLSTLTWEVITSNMRKASSLTLGILTSLYPQADLDAVGEGFVASGAEEDVGDLVQSFIETTTQVIEMTPIDMS